MQTQLCMRIKKNVKKQLEKDLAAAIELLEQTKTDIKEIDNKNEEGFDIAKTEVIWMTEEQKSRVKDLQSKMESVKAGEKFVQLGDAVTVSFIQQGQLGSTTPPIETKKFVIGVPRDKGDEWLPLSDTLVSYVLGKTCFEYVELQMENNHPSNFLIIQHIDKGLEPSNVVDVDSLVEVYDEEFEETEWYFLTQAEGGYELKEEHNGELIDVYVLNTRAPLSTYLLGNAPGSHVQFGNADGSVKRSLKIVNIYT